MPHFFKSHVTAHFIVCQKYTAEECTCYIATPSTLRVYALILPGNAILAYLKREVKLPQELRPVKIELCCSKQSHKVYFITWVL